MFPTATVLLATCALEASRSAEALADAPKSTLPTAANNARLSSDLSGYYLWTGPSLAATYRLQEWDTAIGADVALTRVREQDPLGLAGIAINAVKLTSLDRFRYSVNVLIGNRTALGWMVGASVGVSLEQSNFAPVAPGASASVFVHAGIVPFARVSWTAGRDAGASIDLGVAIPLPAFRWR